MARSWAPCATARMRRRVFGRFARSAGRATRGGSASGTQTEIFGRRFAESGGEEDEVLGLFEPGGFLGGAVVSKRRAVALGDIGMGRDGASGRATGDAFGPHKLRNHGVIFVLGHGGISTPELTLTPKLSPAIVNNGLEQNVR